MAETLKTVGALLALRKYAPALLISTPKRQSLTHNQLTAAACLLRLLVSPISRTEKSKPWRRVIGDSIYRWLLSTVPIRNLQVLFPSTEDVYKAWVKKKNVPLVVDDLPDAEGGKLYWIGNKDAKKVVLYMHSGGFSLALSEAACDLWWYIIRQVKKDTGVDIGIAVLRYGMFFPMTDLHCIILNHPLVYRQDPGLPLPHSFASGDCWP